MYMATIFGYTEIRAFAETEEKAKKQALKIKKRLFPDEPIDKWTWDSVESYYGANVVEIKPNMYMIDSQEYYKEA